MLKPLMYSNVYFDHHILINSNYLVMVWPKIFRHPGLADSEDIGQRMIRTCYAPNFGEVEGAYWFGPVRPSVCVSVRPSVCP